MSKFYGITPMDLEQMTLREVLEYCTQMDEAVADAERDR